MKIALKITNRDELRRRFGDELPRLIREGARDGLNRASMIIWSTARNYAPISPTQGQKDAAREARRIAEGIAEGLEPSVAKARAKKFTAQGRARRNPFATTRAKPGGLVRSIERLVEGLTARVFVAANSEAGRYAKRIHDEKGKSWFNRGVGTVAKGPQADEKFLSRALADKKAAAVEEVRKGIYRRLG